MIAPAGCRAAAGGGSLSPKERRPARNHGLGVVGDTQCPTEQSHPSRDAQSWRKVTTLQPQLVAGKNWKLNTKVL
jgi:hypothetical protein